MSINFYKLSKCAQNADLLGNEHESSKSLSQLVWSEASYAATMDKTDRRIAELLTEDGRASNKAIADALDLSPRLVGARIDSMIENREFRIAAVADVFAAGNDLVLAVGIAVRGRETLAVANDLAELDEVCAVNVVSGEFDLEALVLSADHETLRELVSDRFSAIPGIDHISPALGLELFKFESTWSKF